MLVDPPETVVTPTVIPEPVLLSGKALMIQSIVSEGWIKPNAEPPVLLEVTLLVTEPVEVTVPNEEFSATLGQTNPPPPELIVAKSLPRTMLPTVLLTTTEPEPEEVIPTGNCARVKVLLCAPPIAPSASGLAP